MSARAPESQKLKIVGLSSMAKCKALTGSAMKTVNTERYLNGENGMLKVVWKMCVCLGHNVNSWPTVRR